MRYVKSILCIAMFVVPLLVFAQRPTINPKGIVNSGSYAGDSDGSPLVVPGAIFSIFGQNLATSVLSASTIPVPTELAGTTVMIGGRQAPLFYVSPSQVNFQVPYEASGIATVPVVVGTENGASEPVLARVRGADPSIYTQGGQGCGPGAIQNVGADGSVVLNTQSQSASLGSHVSIYGTAWGPVYPLTAPPVDGQAASAKNVLISGSAVSFGPDGFEKLLGRVGYTGLAPGLVGVYQANVNLLDDVPEGCSVPFRLVTGDATTQRVTISVHRGGGECVNAAQSRFGSLLWLKSATFSSAAPSGSIQESLTAAFAAAPENQVVPLPSPAPLYGYPGYTCRSVPPPTPRCNGTGLTDLDAGELTIQGPTGDPLVVRRSPSIDRTLYAAALPAGSIQPGTFKVSSVGGKDIEVFQTSLSIPPSIEISTPVAPGTNIPIYVPFRMKWTGGSPDQLVRMQVISRLGAGGQYCESAVLASDGEATLPVIRYSPGTGFPDFYALPVGESNNAEIVIIVTPLAEKTVTFPAPGLTRDPTHNWRYEYHFTGLKIGPDK